ncbi:MAG: hypothetical protein IPF48_13700 [Sphingomonadales bacterium]|nr:hypothetical protein [Sphingomonadales bacterium]
MSLRNVSLLCAMGLLQLAVPLLFYARGARSVPAVTLTLIVMLDAVLNPLWPWLVLGRRRANPISLAARSSSAL